MVTPPATLAAGRDTPGHPATPETSPSTASARFREAFGPHADTLDLTLWDRLEHDHPEMFAGMYLLWAQKPRQV